MLRQTPRHFLVPAALTVLGAILFTACGGDSGTGPSETPPDDVTIDLDATSGSPLDEIGLSGLSGQLEADDLWAQFTDPVTGNVAESFVLREGNDWSILAPPHPSDPLGGGTVTLRITDGSKLLSDEVEFTIAPLPETPGAFTAMTDALSGLLTTWLAAHGTSRQELDAADPAQLDDFRAPLYLAYETIDMPSNPNSMRAIADGTSPLIEEFDLDTTFLDAAVGMAGFTGLVELQQARVDSLETLGGEEGGGLVTTGEKVNQVSAQTLNDLMWKAQLASILNGENGQQILKRTTQSLAVIGLHPVMRTASLGLGTGIWGYAKSIEAAENLYPSRFVISEDDLTLNPTDFPEDAEEPGSWTMQPVAVSNGWAADRAILEGIVRYAGAGGLGGVQGKVIERFVNSPTGRGVNNLLLTQGLLKIIGGVLNNPQEGIAQIVPDSWTANVNEFCDAEIVEGNAISMLSGNQFETYEVGSARLRVSKKEGYFGYQALLRFQNVRVNAIEVSLTPDRYDVDPGDEVYFWADVENANDTSLNWTASVGEVQVDGQTGIYQTPSSPWSGPITIKATSAATGGLRADGFPERAAASLVFCSQIEITPAGICLEPGETQVFTAEVTNYDGPYEIAWNASAGFFSGDVYNAPGSPVGQVTITARIVDTTVQESVDITVDECLCQWEAHLSGALSGTPGGDFAAYLDISGEGSTATTFNFYPGATETYPNFAVTVVPAIEEFETGTWLTQTNYITNGSDPYQWFGLADGEFGTQLPVLTITGNSGDSIQGTLSGDLVRIVPSDPPDVQVAQFTLEFSAKKRASFFDNPCE